MKNTMLLAALWNFFSGKTQKIFLAVFLLLFHFKNESTAQTNKPNIILILVDDIGYKSLTCNGGNLYSTPNIDGLAKKGMRFTQCHASPTCSPSRHLLLTGKYNFRNYTDWGEMNPDEKTIGNMMKNAGYKTGFFGKDQLEGGGASINSWGFDDYCVHDALNPGQRKSRYKSPHLYTHGAFIPDSLTLDKYGPDIVSDSLLGFIDKNKSNPFFAFYPMILVHQPMSPTPDDKEFAEWDPKNHHDTSYFSSMTHYMDKKVGELVDKLKSLGIEKNTVIIFSADNGTPGIVGDYNDDDSIVLGGKHVTTEAGTHVPLIVYWPGTVSAGTVNNDLVDFTDILPTLAGIAGIPVPAGHGKLDGVSFAPRLKLQSGTPRKWIFNDYIQRTGRDTLVRWAQTKNYKLYDTSAKEAKRLFYKISKDENELHPLDAASLTKEESVIRKKLLEVINSHVAQGTPLISSTPSLSDITHSSVVLKGTVFTNGGSTITASGAVWSTNPHPKISSSTYTSGGMIDGSISSFIKDLKANTTYYIRAYATNSAGTAYSDQLVFKTLLTPPVATAASAVEDVKFTANWKTYAGAISYKLDVSTSPTFTGTKSTNHTEDFKGGVKALKDWKVSTHLKANTSVFGTSSPALEFTASDASLETPQLKGSANQLKFWIQGINIGTASSLLIEGFDGNSWKKITTLTNIPEQGAAKVYNAGTTPALDTNLIKFRFSYTKKRGTIILDDISINYNAVIPDFVPGYENISVENNSKPVIGLDPATGYYYRVRAKTADNVSINSNVIGTTTKALSDVSNSTVNNLHLTYESCNTTILNAQVFPNPSSSEFALAIQTCKNEKVRVIVTDIYGKKIYEATGTGSNKYLFGKNVNAGVYFVTVNSLTLNKTIKIIKGNQ
ncbi:MAG TPA: sulfatase-like hydrolase/transferase [Parafilimonas sp.]|nr:sulfatase-like hydrolase/transferase [Parafilimonas sp.]